MTKSRTQSWRMQLAAGLLLLLSLVLGACGGDSNSTTASTTVTTTTSATTTVATTTSAAANIVTATPVLINNSTTAAATATTTTVATTIAATAIAATATTGAGAATTATSTPLPVPTVAVSDSARQDLNTTAQQAATIRGLQFKKEVPINFMTRDDLGKYQLASFNRDNPPDQLAKVNKELIVWGFVKPGFDLAKTETDLLTEQILGFYDPETKKFYVVVDQANPNKATALIKFTTEHELTHGLQDQYYDLLKIRPVRKPTDLAWNDDYDNAVTGLIEGDAVNSQTVWLQKGIQQGFLKASDIQELQQEIGSFSQSQIDSAPPILSEALEFPYDDGLKFVQAIYQKGGWDAVNKVWTDSLPKSSSQIIHPDKYFNHVDPVKVDLPELTDILGSGWKTVDINTQGELQTRIWLEGPDKKITSRDDAAKVVSSWAGDRYEVVSDANGNYGYAFRSQWESANKANDFFNAALKYMQPTYGLQGDGGSNQSRTWQTDTYSIALSQKDNQVLVVVMPKGDATSKIVSKLGF
jgi:hypothetical protein